MYNVQIKYFIKNVCAFTSFRNHMQLILALNLTDLKC